MIAVLIDVNNVNSSMQYMLSAKCLDHVLRYSGEVAQNQHLAGYVALQYAMQMYDNTVSVPLQVDWDANGKPFLIGSSLHISISNTDKYALACVSSSPVGVDVECINSVKLSLAAKVLSSQQLQQFELFETDEEKRQLLAVNWCIKESYLKLTGEGSVLSFNKWTTDSTSENSLDNSCVVANSAENTTFVATDNIPKTNINSAFSNPNNLSINGNPAVITTYNGHLIACVSSSPIPSNYLTVL